MNNNEKRWFEEHRKWMRPDAHLRVRPDAQKWLPAGVRHPALPLPDEHKARPAPSGEEAARMEVQGEGISELDWLELRAMLSDLKLDFQLACLRRKYSPDQPRVPAGLRDGGQWVHDAGAILAAPLNRERSAGRRATIRVAGVVIRICVAGSRSLSEDDFGNKWHWVEYQCAGGRSFRQFGSGHYFRTIVPDPFQ